MAFLKEYSEEQENWLKKKLKQQMEGWDYLAGEALGEGFVPML